MNSRRRFLRLAGTFASAGLLADPWRAVAASSMAMPMHARTRMPVLAAPRVELVNPRSLEQFVDALPIPPIASPAGSRADPLDPQRMLPCYRMAMREFHSRLHRDLPPTQQWGFEGLSPGPTISAKRGEPFLVEWINALPTRHFLPIDHNLHGAEASAPDVRTVTHVHGARVSADNDGWPEDAFVPGRSLLYRYPVAQDAATLWYHDHAMGLTRLNIYAGLFGAFVVHDPEEQALGLPTLDRDLPLVLCDRLIARDGQLYYPVSDDPAAPWVSETHGNAVLCNGKLFPVMDVAPARYRLRLINAANASFFDLSLSQGLTFRQVASDQGLLSSPTERTRIDLYPAERADVIVDFANHAGQTVHLLHASEAIMAFRVRASGSAETAAIPATLRAVERLDPDHAQEHRVLALGEMDDAGGNPMRMLLDGHAWTDPVTEKPRQGTTETWSFVNVTNDAHPVHLHLVRFQVVDRRPFDLFAWNAHRKLVFTGPAETPPPHEMGWKDTVRCDPGMVTRIVARFDGEPGRYVWHCHMLEHEDNEMMRPWELLPSQATLPVAGQA